MSLYSLRNQAVFAMAERERLEPPEDAHDFLADKPEGFCPWCGEELDIHFVDIDGGYEFYGCNGINCFEWSDGDTESENRLCYAKEKEAEAKIETKIARESSLRDEEF